MLLLALVGLLVTAAAEPLPRVPGMRFRLGMAESELLQLGGFPEAKVPEVAGVTTRRGAARCFGVPGEAICTIKDRRLERVRFEAAGVSRHSQDYVDGQLRRLRLERGCDRDLPGDRVCGWVGAVIRVGTRMRKDSLVVRYERWPTSDEPVTDSLRGPVTVAPAALKPPAPRATPVAARAAPPAAPPVPAARATTPPSPASTRHDPDGPAVPLVATIPETLTISLTSRNSPDLWPRIVSSPPLDYPAGARRESIQGVVWVLALVETDGRVNDAWIERGIPELDTAALAWISRSRFAPCERQGRPCRFHVRVAVRFTLY